MEHQFSNPKDALNFITAGDAIFTLCSKKSGKHLTFKVTRVDEQDKFFVGLLSGPDNNTSYFYLGMIVPNVVKFPMTQPSLYTASTVGYKFCLTKKSRATDGAESVKALRYVLEALSLGQLPHGVQIWHEGRCGRCGRRLTVPSSIEAGIGPDCATRM